MWTSSEFIEKYLRPMGQVAKWDSLIYPAMKDAIICSMLVAQDSIDTRKVTKIREREGCSPSVDRLELLRIIRRGFHARRRSQTLVDRNQL